MSIVKSFAVGKGDMFFINHNSDSFSIIDCCYDDRNTLSKDFGEIKDLSKKKGIIRFISTHPDEDHINGLPILDREINILNFYCVPNQAIKKEETDNFIKYCQLRDSNKAFFVTKGCQRKWINQEDTERGSAGISFLWPDTENIIFKEAQNKANRGEEYNNISPIFIYSTSKAKFLWMGDMETSFQEKIQNSVNWEEVDVLFAPHHGRCSGKVPSTILDQIKPKIIVIGEAESENLNYYKGYNTLKQNSAGDIVFDCDDSHIHIYVQESDYKNKYPLENLKQYSKSNFQGMFYLGSL